MSYMTVFVGYSALLSMCAAASKPLQFALLAVEIDNGNHMNSIIICHSDYTTNEPPSSKQLGHHA
jgi:hypothetical protein